MRGRNGLTAIPMLGLALAAGAAPAAGQSLVIDEGTLEVRRGDVVLARESFTVARTSADRHAGWRIAATVHYPADQPRVTLSPIVELGPDSLPRMVQFDARDRGEQRVLAEFGRRRLTVRIISSSGESAREYPTPRRPLVVDDSVLSLYAVPPGLAPGRVRLTAPRQGVQSDYVLENRGLDETTLAGRRQQLVHLVLTSRSDDDARHLWYDQEGRLMKVEIPGRQLVAERVATRRR